MEPVHRQSRSMIRRGRDEDKRALVLHPRATGGDVRAVGLRART